MTRRPALLLFARAPEPGRVKTRLAAALTERGACGLYRAFLEDAARVYVSAAWDSELRADPGPDDPVLAELFPQPWTRRAQGEGDLGERLDRAFRESFASGASAAAAVGSDHPGLPVRRIEEVFASLSASDAAVIPAEDGGYCAIGLAAGAPVSAVFRGVPWSTPGVLAETLDRIRGAGRTCRVLEPFWDVDRPGDLERLRRELAARDPQEGDFPRATARFLAENPAFGAGPAS